MHTDIRGNTSGLKCHKNETETKVKYRSLCIEIQRMWKMKCMIIPVINGVTGIVTEGLKKILEAMPG
jgi:hypothetical protein